MLLEQQAGDFFNAYEVLMESNQALIDKHSNSTDTPSLEKAFGTRPTMSVAIVCLAFSVELYIKYLHYKITKESPRGHDILKLFLNLPESVQQRIFTYHSIAKYGWNFSQFKNEIQAISDGFKKWRYSHEYTSLQYNNYFALVFIEAIKSVAASK